MSRIEIDDLEPMSATDAKTYFGEVLHDTSVNQKEIVVERRGRPVSVILGYNRYRELLEKAGELDENS